MKRHAHIRPAFDTRFPFTWEVDFYDGRNAWIGSLQGPYTKRAARACADAWTRCERRKRRKAKKGAQSRD